MMSNPAVAMVRAMAANVCGLDPIGFTAVHTRGRLEAPKRDRSPGIPKRGPRNSSSIESGKRRPQTRTPGNSETLPHNKLSTCTRPPPATPGSYPMVMSLPSSLST